MTFLLPQALAALALVPILIAAYLIVQRRRKRYSLRYASLSLVREAVGPGPGLKRHVPAALFLLAVIAAVLALSRPQITMAQYQQRGIVMLSVDVSGSMAADDVTPSRITALQGAVRNFVQDQPDGVQIGLVSFNDQARLLQPPTSDKASLIQAVGGLQAGGGTNIGDGLRVALDSIYQATDIPRPAQSQSGAGTQAATPPADVQQAPASIVLVSDGGSNTGPPPLNVAQEAAAAGIKVYTVGIGTAQGTVLHVQGQSVLTRLDEPTLQGIASATGGQYFNAQSESQLAQVYSDLGRQQQVEDKPVEVTYLAASGALALMLASAVLSLLWFNRLP
jgi:Ca-activated chloride channel family protein